ncbi:MAG: 2-C-methyl-D-erythritol 2,4-cyclodiphosphate synthase [Pirellulales bacterium]|nr:2-C-methyl-D-erythritol 2,4-cyclodiphosphate synthase [Pirellulales bacterium]
MEYNSRRNETTRKGDGATDGPRVGIGHDTHRLTAGGPLRLGGIDIPHDREMVGHSDGDALLHAVVDALLGAAAAGDVGQMFPDSDPANRGRDSAEMLEAARDAIRALGWRVGNLDCIVHAQRPRLLPHRQAIRKRIADILGIDPELVSLKGKTGEGVGPVGEEQIIVAQCVALLLPR